MNTKTNSNVNESISSPNQPLMNEQPNRTSLMEENGVNLIQQRVVATESPDDDGNLQHMVMSQS